MEVGVRTFGFAAAVAALLCFSASAKAADWWPLKVKDGNANGAVIDYVPLEKAAKPWNICALLPHVKDSFFVAVDYGLVAEATRENVNLTVHEAGGYDQLPKQLAQFDSCLEAKPDAIIIAAISEEGVRPKLLEAAKRNIPVIASANPITETPVAAKVYSSFGDAAGETGKALLQHLDGKPAKAATFPGPQGSGWAEALNQGFLDSIKGSAVDVLEQAFGDAQVEPQRKLLEEALAAHPDLSVIWGTAPTAQAAIELLAASGGKDVTIVSAYENQAMLEAVERGDVLGFATAFPVLNGRVALDMAVRAIEQKPAATFVQSIPHFVSKETIDKTDLSLVFAPKGFSPVYAVTAK